MSPITQEWVEKAEGDFATAERESNVTSNPNYDATCFHAQQCIEKYLKARLQEAGITFGKTHDLTSLLDIVLAVEPGWDTLRADLQADVTQEDWSASVRACPERGARKKLVVILAPEPVSRRFASQRRSWQAGTLALQSVFSFCVTSVQALNAFAVAYRYPGDSAGISEAQEAVLKCRNIRLMIRQSLSL